MLVRTKAAEEEWPFLRSVFVFYYYCPLSTIIHFLHFISSESSRHKRIHVGHLLLSSAMTNIGLGCDFRTDSSYLMGSSHRGIRSVKSSFFHSQIIIIRQNAAQPNQVHSLGPSNCLSPFINMSKGCICRLLNPFTIIHSNIHLHGRNRLTRS